MHLRISIAIMSILIFASSAFAGDLTAKVQQKYDSLNSFRADFVQTLTTAASGEQEIRKGTITFKQPSLLRWDTVSPEKELLIVGESYVWDYYPDDMLALKYRAEQVFNSKTMIRFISGKARLEEDFAIENQGTEDGLVKLKLLPTEPEPGLVLGYVWVDPETSMLKKVLAVDFYGNGNQVDLSNISLNPEIEQGAFDFAPPADVIVEDNTKNKK